MIEVFITDIQTEIQAGKISGIIQNENADLKINFDLNETEFPFPCGHTILRVEGNKVNSDEILATVRSKGFHCEILEDKICIQKDIL
jgi:hypothetical protein